MKGLVFDKSIPRYLLLKLLGSRVRGLCTGMACPVSLRDVTPPTLPRPDWVRVAPRLAGICGSDLATICAKGSPYLAPVTSMPFVMGHEVIGTVTEIGGAVSRVRVGDRVVLHPALGCRARGINPPCDACSQQRDALCRNVTRGSISPGLQTGYCRDTGGGFGQELVAHESQLYHVPNELDDTTAVLIEPFACALHGVFRAAIKPDDTVLVIGAGAIGLLTIAALRGIGCRARIVAVARYDHQRQHAQALGVNELLDDRGSVTERYARWAKVLGAEVLKAEIGKPAVIGGADVTFDCVASSQTIDDGIRFTRSGGTFVLIGMPGVPHGVDWTPLWFKELTLHAAYAYGPERRPDGVRDTFDVAIELMKTQGEALKNLVGSLFALADYRVALAAAINTGRSHVVKTVFAVNDQ
jgi:threonine dehydrogenase-like Zn-dependent dehydrogenase